MSSILVVTKADLNEDLSTVAETRILTPPLRGRARLNPVRRRRRRKTIVEHNNQRKPTDVLRSA